MANFYTDIPELKYHLNNPMMERICQLKERDYRDKDEFDYAPQDYADAMDSYDKILEITGEITGETIAPNAEGVDEEGPHCGNGRVEYASGTKQNLDAMVKAGLNGMTMPRRFGGLNFPITPYTMCAEIVAAADAGFGNIWSLQVWIIFTTSPSPPTPCARKLLPPPMQVSETSGLCKTVSKRCMNSVTKTSTAVSFPVFVQVKPCLWT